MKTGRSESYPGARKSFLPHVAAALLAGCASMDSAHVPTKLGNLNDGVPDAGMKATLQPDAYQARIGDVIGFTVLLENTGEKAVWVPRDPAIMLAWVYPDGKRDNFIEDKRKPEPVTRAAAVLLEPGAARKHRIAIPTYYFNRSGITEFRAYVTSDQPLQDELDPFWTGEAASNGFGIMMNK